MYERHPLSMNVDVERNLLSMDQEWLFLHKHRNFIMTYIVGCVMYWIVYAGYIDRTSLRFDEVWVSNFDTIFLAAGRWCGYLFRALLGHGPGFPIVGIMAGLLLNLAILVQLKLFGLKCLWQMLAYTTLYLCSIGWIDNLQYSTMSDFFAASVLLATLAVHFIRKKGLKNQAAATLSLTLAFGCFQSSGICFLALVMLVGFQAMLTDDKTAVRHLICNTAVIGFIAFFIFWVGTVISYQCAPADMQMTAKTYQQGLIGWREVFASPETNAVEYIWRFVLKVPLGRMSGLAPIPGQWLYATVWIPAALLVLHAVRTKGRKKGMLTALFLAALIYTPFLFCTVLLHPKGGRPYMCMAQPIVLCGVWTFGVLADSTICRKHRYILLAFLLGVFVKNAYIANISARNDRYFFELERQEMREMYLLAKVAAKQASLPNGPYLVCGKVTGANQKKEIGGYLYPDSALPHFYEGGHMVDAFAAFFRLTNMRAAAPDEVANHARTLSQMPSWPDPDSVRADGNAVLIKIGDSPDPKNP